MQNIPTKEGHFIERFYSLLGFTERFHGRSRFIECSPHFGILQSVPTKGKEDKDALKEQRGTHALSVERSETQMRFEHESDNTLGAGHGT